MSFYRRRLPHWHPAGQPLFVTFRLQGSLPPQRFFPMHTASSGQAFAVLNRLLDQGRSGPLYLPQPALAHLAVGAVRYGAANLQHYDLHASVVMPNRVHLPITPPVPVSDLLRSLMGITAKRANRLPARTGQSFWQEESYAHVVRDECEFARIQRYIEQNPVRAGLVPTVEPYE